jgi:hypothetical protein
MTRYTQTKRSWLHLWCGRPGTRFQNYYHLVHVDGSTPSLAPRIAKLAMAFVFFVIAACLFIIPLVHVPFFFASAALLASESLRFARVMDKGEAWSRENWNAMLRKFGLSGAAANVAATALGLGCLIVTGCVYYGEHLR